MKKVLVLILCISMMVGLTACNNSNDDKDSKDKVEDTKVSGETEEEKETEETKEIKESEETIEEETKETETETEKETKETEKATEKETEESKDHQSKPAPKETEAAKPAYKRVDDVKYAKSNVNVRSGPGASYKRLQSLINKELYEFLTKFLLS